MELSRRKRAATLLALFFTVVAGGFAVLGWDPDVVVKATERLSAAADTNDQASTRFALWEAAVAAMRESWLIGWGPGAYSLPDDDGVRQEAHNTLLDWGTQAGIGGVLVLSALAVLIFARLYAARRQYLLGSTIALFAFAMFHFVLRQPAFWVLALLPAWTVAATRHSAAVERVRGGDAAVVREQGIRARHG
jgi:O-antigen ligase